MPLWIPRWIRPTTIAMACEEVQDMMARLEESDCDELADDDVYQTMRFDLCPECRKRFLKHPLGREAVKQFDFSQN